MSLLKLIQLLFCLLLVMLAGCASTTVETVNKPIYWPKAPVEPRYMYVTTLRSEEGVRLETSEDRFKKVLSGITEQPRVFGKPFDVAAREGLVVVSDTVLRRAFIFNLQRQKLYQFGRVGIGRAHV